MKGMSFIYHLHTSSSSIVYEPIIGIVPSPISANPGEVCEANCVISKLYCSICTSTIQMTWSYGKAHAFNMYVYTWLWACSNFFCRPTFDINSTESQEILLRADYHGCLVKVIQSKCPSYVGVIGIIMQDTKETFKIINKKNIVKGRP